MAMEKPYDTLKSWRSLPPVIWSELMHGDLELLLLKSQRAKSEKSKNPAIKSLCFCT